VRQRSRSQIKHRPDGLALAPLSLAEGLAALSPILLVAAIVAVLAREV